jgi:sulfofructose kinase
VACVGHAAIDHVFEVDAFATQPVKTPAHGYRMQAGGMAHNAAVAASRLGASVRMLGRVGDDAAAVFLRQHLGDEGVEARGLEAVGGASTSVSAIIVAPDGERQIYNHRGSALAKAHALDTAQLHGADIVLADPRWPAGALSALRWAREHRVPSILDADVAPAEDLRRLVALAQWVVFSAPGLATFAPALDESDGLAQALGRGCDTAMVTRGTRSVLWRCRDDPLHELHEAAVPRVAAVDTTGAGDIFHGALAVAWAEGMTLRDGVRFAGAAAALKCRNGAGALGAPTRDQVRAFLGGERDGR